MKEIINKFFSLEAASGIVLLGAAVLAMVVANSPYHESYQHFLHLDAGVFAGQMIFYKSVSHWINDGLMALFFLLVGLEIKREMLFGELKGWKQASLPVMGAIGGVVVPALIYLGFNHGTADARGWAIPSATDIAFSLGVLALMGSRVPSGLKVFLMAVAVIDDLIAVLIIAFFYTEELNLSALANAGSAMAVIFLLAHLKVRHIWPYMVVGFFMWIAVLHSGIHATIAGVVLGLMMPHRVKDAPDGKPLSDILEDMLHPMVAYGIMPIFAFANAGVPLAGMTVDDFLLPVPLGIATGLFFGKQLGIFAVCALMIRLGYARLPTGANWCSFYGTCAVAGIGFTMSLFIGTLAFTTTDAQDHIRLGVLVGSMASALAGYAMLRWGIRK